MPGMRPPRQRTSSMKPQAKRPASAPGAAVAWEPRPFSATNRHEWSRSVGAHCSELFRVPRCHADTGVISRHWLLPTAPAHRGKYSRISSMADPKTFPQRPRLRSARRMLTRGSRVNSGRAKRRGVGADSPPREQGADESVAGKRRAPVDDRPVRDLERPRHLDGREFADLVLQEPPNFSRHFSISTIRDRISLLRRTEIILGVVYHNPRRPCSLFFTIFHRLNYSRIVEGSSSARGEASRFGLFREEVS